MGEFTDISWTDASWNPWHGCHKISPGCKNCYMFRDKKRYGQDPNVAVRSKTKFDEPLRWKDPKLIFTCSWSDWFIEEADAWRDEAWDIIRRTPQHTYQILTKRADRMEGRVPNPPLPNAWLGVSVENQQYADERIPILLNTPAMVRFLSVEPLLGPVSLREISLEPHGTWLPNHEFTVPGKINCLTRDDEDRYFQADNPVDWVIVGGESGHDARPMHPEWACAVRDQCVVAGIPFHFKQWGEWRPREAGDSDLQDQIRLTNAGENGQIIGSLGGNDVWMQRVGKKAAGRLLDGREWNEFPEVVR